MRKGIYGIIGKRVVYSSANQLIFMQGIYGLGNAYLVQQEKVIVVVLGSRNPFVLCMSCILQSTHPERFRAYHIAAHPSASWKLNAISVPFDSVQTMSVSIKY